MNYLKCLIFVTWENRDIRRPEPNSTGHRDRALQNP